jgi:hypothetical protein
MSCKKQRGQKRRLRALLENINRFVPFTDTGLPYEQFSVPCGRFISSPKTSGKVKTAFCRAWLRKTEQILAQKPANLPFCRVTALLDETDLWRSQIIVFYDRDYYGSFWERDTVQQKWTPQEGGRAFAKERNIETGLTEKGYLQIIADGDTVRRSVLWFYGDV